MRANEWGNVIFRIFPVTPSSSHNGLKLFPRQPPAREIQPRPTDSWLASADAQLAMNLRAFYFRESSDARLPISSRSAARRIVCGHRDARSGDNNEGERRKWISRSGSRRRNERWRLSQAQLSSAGSFRSPRASCPAATTATFPASFARNFALCALLCVCAPVSSVLASFLRPLSLAASWIIRGFAGFSW